MAAGALKSKTAVHTWIPKMAAHMLISKMATCALKVHMAERVAKSEMASLWGSKQAKIQDGCLYGIPFVYHPRWWLASLP